MQKYKKKISEGFTRASHYVVPSADGGGQQCPVKAPELPQIKKKKQARAQFLRRELRAGTAAGLCYGYSLEVENIL